MNAHAKKRIHYAVMAIVFVGLQTISMAVPANAAMLNDIGNENLQTMTAKNVEQEPITRDTFEASWIVFPVDAGLEVISSGFGYRAKACYACSTNHQGIDFIKARGSTIRAVFYGVVTKVQDGYGSFGSYVEIKHGDLGGIETVYAHMIQGSQTVKVGDSVVPGQKIGRVGMTGTATVNHLHFGIYVDGYAIDPAVWLTSHHATRYGKNGNRNG